MIMTYFWQPGIKGHLYELANSTFSQKWQQDTRLTVYYSYMSTDNIHVVGGCYPSIEGTNLYRKVRIGLLSYIFGNAYLYIGEKSVRHGEDKHFMSTGFSRATYRDHFVRHLSVPPSIYLLVCLIVTL